MAQERSIFHDMLRESLKMDLMEIAIPVATDSNFHKEHIINDMNEENLRRMLFRHRFELLLPNEERFMDIEKPLQIAPQIKMFSYTNSIDKPLDNGKFNGTGKFTGEFASKADNLMSKAAPFMVSFSALMTPATEKKVNKKESEKEKALRIIKEIYQIDD